MIFLLPGIQLVMCITYKLLVVSYSKSITILNRPPKMIKKKLLSYRVNGLKAFLKIPVPTMWYVVAFTSGSPRAHSEPLVYLTAVLHVTLSI